MDDNTDEQKQYQHELKTASTWLADAREWVQLANQMQSETGASPNTISPQPNKQNVARGCVATAFQLTYNALLVADAKWPRQDDGLAQTHGRLQKDTQDELDELIAGAGFNDPRRLLKFLDRNLRAYPAPPRPFFPEEDVEQDGNHEFQLPSMAHLLEHFRVAAERNLNDAKAAAPPRKLHPEQEPREVLGKIQEIVNLSRDGDYIYRGEPEEHDKVSSNLYRTLERNLAESTVSVQDIQDEMLKEAKAFAQGMNEDEIPTQLQHYGGKTNLIDFTHDYLVALFFACDGSHDEDSRVILLEKAKALEKGCELKPPLTSENRVIAQKSIFVVSRNGFIGQCYKSIKIPRALRKPMLDYLHRYHGISMRTIYNDLDGYSRYQRRHKSAYAKFAEGLAYHIEGRDNTENANEDFDCAIGLYTRALKLNPQFAGAYNHRGAAYLDKYESNAHGNSVNERTATLNCAIENFDKAINILPEYAFAHHNRGLANYHLGHFKRAIQDFDRVISLEPNNAEAYNDRGAAFNCLNKHARALSDFTRAIGLNPSLWNPYYNRGKAYFRTEEYRSALHDFNRATELNPKSERSYFYSGLARAALKEKGMAMADLTAARNLGLDIAAECHKRYPTITALEKSIGAALPEDIAQILGYTRPPAATAN